MNSLVSYHTEGDGIYSLVFDFGDTSQIIGQEFTDGLASALDQLAEQKDLQALVIYSAHPGVFVQGTNFQELATLTPKEAEERSRKGQELFQKLSNLPLPVICAIEGICAGAGLELALACHYRLGANNRQTQLGFTREVGRGLIPFYGGTQILSRMVGIPRTLDLILSGRTLGAQEALQWKIFDQLSPEGSLLQQARDFARDILTAPPSYPFQRENKLAGRHYFFSKSWFGRYLIKRSNSRRLGPIADRFPAAYQAMLAVISGYRLPLPAGLELEARYLKELLKDRNGKNVFYFHLATDSMKNHLNPEILEAQPPQVAVVGAGTRGSAVAALLANREVPIRLKDINHQTLGMALKTITETIHQKEEDGEICRRREALVAPTVLYRGMKNAAFIIESVIEDLEIKKRVLREIEKSTGPDAIIASTTSSFTLVQLAEGSSCAERLVGMNFFEPLGETSVVEIIQGPNTSEETLENVTNFVKKLEKIPLVVKDSPGFLVQRVALPYLNEALMLLEEGLLVEEIDKALENFGMNVGPLSLIDQLGLDTLFHLSSIFSKMDRDFEPSPIIDKFYKIGRLGLKSDKGIYIYEKDKKKRVDPKVYDIIKEIRGERTRLEEEVIVDRLLLPMIREAALCLTEEIVSDPREMEVALAVALGFPAYHGGLFQYANERGMEDIVKTMKKLTQNFGRRFEVGEILLKYHHQKKQFNLVKW